MQTSIDSKGAAFEYFVRATLKGKKLGQYFTPRPLVKLMLYLGHWEQILNSLRAREDFKVLDPACGTGGFLVLAMNLCLDDIDRQLKSRAIHRTLADKLRSRVKSDVFYGIDAHDGVACSAKMNMIIAGDGYNNIRCADSLNESRLVPAYGDSSGKRCVDGKAHLILTNPPFGTSEAESLSEASAATYPIRSTRGQSLFIQKMILSAHHDSMIVTVIDEGVLNTASYEELRRYILQSCRIETVLALPEDTFKPNKINVRSSVLVLRRRKDHDEDTTDDYPVSFVTVDSLGYEGSGDEIRGFDLPKLIAEVVSVDPYALALDTQTTGYNWSAFAVKSTTLAADKTARFDVRYWRPDVRFAVERLRQLPGAQTIADINTIETKRGKSPPAAEYVSANEGHAIVVKSGSNISKAGELTIDGADYIELPVYQEYVQKQLTLEDGDILLASTGDGTLGKCCVYRNNDENGKAKPAVPEGHVTVIRVNQAKVYPEYLCDYLRKGFGHDQLYRTFTGSTGMVEITPSDVDEIVVPAMPLKRQQKQLSRKLRNAEQNAAKIVTQSESVLLDGETEFRVATTPREITT